MFEYKPLQGHRVNNHSSDHKYTEHSAGYSQTPIEYGITTPSAAKVKMRTHMGNFRVRIEGTFRSGMLPASILAMSAVDDHELLRMGKLGE